MDIVPCIDLLKVWKNEKGAKSFGKKPNEITLAQAEHHKTEEDSKQSKRLLTFKVLTFISIVT